MNSVRIFVLVCLATICTGAILTDCDGIVLNDASFGTHYNCTVRHNHSIQLLYRYNMTDSKMIGKQAVRIYAQSVNASTTFPVLFVVKQQRSVLSWAIPTILTTSDGISYEYSSVGRTLCPERTQEIYVDISTMNMYSTRFQLVANLESISISDDQGNISVSPAKSRFYRFDFPHNVSSVVVKAESIDDLCTVLSVQDVECPVYDMVGTVEHAGYRQTMTRRGAITVERNTFYNASFFIVLVVKPNDLDCEKFQRILFSSSSSEETTYCGRNKVINIIIEATLSRSKFFAVIFSTLAFFLAFYVVALVVGITCHYRNRSSGIEDESNIRNCLIDPNQVPTSYGAVGSLETRDLTEEEDCPINDAASSRSTTPDSSASNLRRGSRRTCLCVAELSKKPEEKLAKKYRLYVWNLVTLAIFYVLPVIQLVITYQMVVNKTGDEDICYYNFECAYKVGFLSAFNNVYSNIGYIMLGMLFIILVYRRKLLHEKMAEKRNPNFPECGIPQHFGVFYAMGIALAMEGVLSGCYHVCPSFNNFQFDTAFMYIIGWLCMLKMYQTRHPDANAHAHTAYCAIAFVVFFGVIGVTQGSPAFWIVFVVIYVLCSLYLSINIYYIGQWRLKTGILRGLYCKVRNENPFCSRPRDCSRLVLLVFGNIVNIGFAIFGAVTMPKDFASYLLAIVIINLLMYFAFYIFMKVRCGEKILFLAAVYIFLAAVVWGVALYFFMQRLTSWQLTPAMSRESNEECLLFKFYDSHDIWHFLSAISLFLSFMILLVLEDDLVDVPRDQISVF